MPIKILMPALSPTMEKGKLSRWVVKPGDKLNVSDHIADVETDKATMEMESVDAGVFACGIEEGTSDISVGALICILAKPGENHAEFKWSDFSGSDVVKTKKESVQQTAEPEATQSQSPSTFTKKVSNASSFDKRIKITPIAKAIANDGNINISEIVGSGPSGRIRKADVEAASFVQPSSKTQELNSMQKIIAQRMVTAKAEVPHFYADITVDVSNLITMRARLNKNKEKSQKITLNDLVIKATATAISQCPYINIFYKDNCIVHNSEVNVAFAVGVEGGILVTPIIQQADTKNIWTIAESTKQAISEIKEGKYPSSSAFGSITISNLGMYGIERFISIINQPMSLGMAVGCAYETLAMENKEVIVKHKMNITISADHRVINGLECAKFMSILKGIFEVPELILAG